MVNVTHTRVRWTSRRGVEFAPTQANGKLPYGGTYSASNGWTDIRYFYISLDTHTMDIIVKPGATVPEIAKESKVELAINGPFAFGDGNPLGYIVKDEKLINNTTATIKWADFISYQNEKIEIGQLDKNKLDGIKFSFSSTPQIVKDGKIHVDTFGEGTPKDVYAGRRPRTGIGFTRDNRVIGIVADGDSRWDAGLRVDELGAVMIKLGAMEALNCDGGGSSVLVQDGKAISANKGTRHLGAAIVFNEKAVLPVLRKGDHGEAVKQLQENLAAAGFSPGAIDGIFGDTTENAVKQFQQDHQLVADGIVGQKTWSTL